MKKIAIGIISVLFLVASPVTITLAGETKSDLLKIPNSVLDVSKENTYPNPTQDIPLLQPSKLSTELLETANVKIENPLLIKLLNESYIKNGPISIGYKAKIFLGSWALNYESTETTVNWEFKKVNVNYYDNRGGDETYPIRFNQNNQRIVQGGLTSKVESADDVKKMMMQKAMKHTSLPLSFQTVIGAGTKKEQSYNIASNHIGYLYSYVPAVNEKGKITFGEVYLVLKGNKKSIQVKNITSHGIGAWIPVQDRLSFMFITSKNPR